MANNETQVVIVGGGPVGLGLAIELGQRGIATTVLEKTRDLHRIPKGQNLTQRTMEHLRSWGVEDTVRSLRPTPPHIRSGGVNAFGSLLGDYAHAWFRRSDVDQFYFAASERLPQYLTERALRARADQISDIEVRYDTAALSVGQDDSGTFVDTNRGRMFADFVVGCDGSRSVVRSQAGIGETRTDHDRRMVLLVFRSHQLRDLLAARHEDAAFFFVLDPALDGYWRFLGTVDGESEWFFHAPVDEKAGGADPAAMLHRAVGAEFDVELVYHGFWDLRIAIADTYRQGRLLIAGDAAHSHPPYGGYGINTGFEDARNLGWKMAAVLQGWGTEKLLDSYTEERRAVFVSTARDFIEAFIEDDRRFLREHDPADDDFEQAWRNRRTGSGRAVNTFAPHYEGSSIVAGPPGGITSAVGEHSLAARPGHLLPPPRVPFGDLGGDFTILSALAADVGSVVDEARRLGVPLEVKQVDRLTAAQYGHDAVLVRPDHYIAWADGAAGEDAVATASGQ